MPFDRGSDADAWDRYSATYQQAMPQGTDTAWYGPDIPDERQLRLLGDLKGKRVLDLGCGGGQAAVAFARAGAATVGIDQSTGQLAHARRLADAAEVRVELRQGDVADLAFLRADSIDVAFSAYAFAHVDDLPRVFRQVHRVLKLGGTLVFSLPHPAWAMIDDAPGPLAGRQLAEPDPGGTTGTAPVVRRSYFDRTPITTERAGGTFVEHPHSFAELYMALHRSSYRVDAVLEPEPLPGAHRSSLWREAQTMVPRTLVIRARKEGS